MAVLVAGGCGYIGSHTCVEFLNKGFDVVVADNLCNSSAVALERVEELTGKHVPFYPVDVRDREALRPIFSAHSIDCVIQFAGLKAVGESVQKPLEYYDNNLNATLSLCAVMKEFGVKRMIFSSSATVYGEENPIPYLETMPTGECTNPYGWTKVMSEKILQSVAHTDPEWSVVLLRYFNPIGAHPSGRMGEDPEGIPNNLMPYITQVAVGKREQLSIFGNDYPTPDGTCIRDYIHVVDLARGHVAAMEYAMGHTGTEIFNLGTGNGVSVSQLVDAFERVNDLKVPHVFAARRAGDLPAFYANADKAKQVLGWSAEYTIDDMCRDSWNWQKNNPNGYRS
jgi:UDP-glucose 4-epimerase